MHFDRDLAAEIRSQLEGDILHFAWLTQIACLQNSARSEADNIRAVIDSVTELHAQGKLVVGNAREVNGNVLIEPWMEAGHDLNSRMTSTVNEFSGDDRDFCFWIQLADHFAR